MPALLLLAALIAVNIAYLALLDRNDRRERAERAAAAERADAERQVLLQRIQAPEQAVYEHATSKPAATHVPPAAGFDDDESFWQARGEFSREELAAALAEAEMAERAPTVTG